MPTANTSYTDLPVNLAKIAHLTENQARQFLELQRWRPHCGVIGELQNLLPVPIPRSSFAPACKATKERFGVNSGKLRVQLRLFG